MNILVTGASKGIGKVIAENLKSVGNVFVTGRNEKALKSIGASGFCVCDLAKDFEIIVNFVVENNIDVLINNAGEYVYGGVEEVGFEEIERIFMTNLVAPTKLISKVVPFMKQNKWGRIVNIGSISGVMGEAYASSYSGSKAGLVGLTKSLALELAEFGITINTINPGWVETDLGLNSIEESDFTKEEILEGIPQKRFVQPEEVANLVKYLVTEQAKGLTGQSINLCAGLSVGI
ncbi:MAG: SDR family oxidoreductase [Candidatus Gastranaerophilales bacterium]